MRQLLLVISSDFKFYTATEKVVTDGLKIFRVCTWESIVLVATCMMLIHESPVFELRIETKFEACDA